MSSQCNSKCEGCSDENCQSRIEKAVLNSKSHIKHTIAIVSGKGGVGKSFVTTILGLLLNAKGFRVGILDGDITGPSIPKSFNLHGTVYGDKDGLIVPLETKKGLKVISSNLLLENEDEPIIWRGSLVSNLLLQFYKDVYWGELDYLLIDMPPGTGDVTLTSFQSIPLEGILIVTTPQDLVSLIVTKAINMSKMMDIPILGIVENMSYIICPKCKERIDLYGESHLKDEVKDLNIPILAEFPISPVDTKLIDKGEAENIELAKYFKFVDNFLKKENKND